MRKKSGVEKTSRSRQFYFLFSEEGEKKIEVDAEQKEEEVQQKNLKNSTSMKMQRIVFF